MDDEEKFEKYVKAEHAIKDILYMFYTCVSYQSLFSDMGTEDGNFDPFYYIDSSESKTGYETDHELLQHGSAIKLACRIQQNWEQGGYEGFDSKGLKPIKDLVASNRIDHLPNLIEYLINSLHSYSRAMVESPVIYQNYVAGYFKKLVQLHRHSHTDVQKRSPVL